MTHLSRGRIDIAERALQLVKKADDPPPPPTPPAPESPREPTFEDLRFAQASEARELLDRDLSRAVRWPWRDMDALVGPMLDGEVHVVGALTGNGKSTFVASAIDAFSLARVPLLYFPFEVDPAVYLNKRAAWKLGIDVVKALRQQWADLGPGAKEAMGNILEELEQDPFVHVASEKRATVGTIRKRAEAASEEFGCRVVILDHIGRVSFPGGERSQPREQYAQMMRDLKDMARELKLVVIAAAQLNRLNDVIDYFSPPHIARLAESAVIGHESDVTVMLSRKLKNNLPDGYVTALKAGRISEADIAEPGVMRVTCRKHRLDDEALNRSAYLAVVNGRVGDQIRGY